jgi:non-ribosomal peptide synthetase component F
MSLKTTIAKPYARYVTDAVMRRALDPVATQAAVLTRAGPFRWRHRFRAGAQAAPVFRTIPAWYRPCPCAITKASSPTSIASSFGEEDVLWPGKPLYLCKTSGTTSGAKYIPITPESLPNHIGSARRALLAYIATAAAPTSWTAR